MSNATDTIEELKPSSSAALRSVVVFWGSVALIQFGVFCLFRGFPKFRNFYNVRNAVEKLKCGLAAKEVGPWWNVLAWIPAVLRATDDEIFEQVGLDGLSYLRSVKMGIKLSLMGCFVAAWSIPTYFTSPRESHKEVNVSGSNETVQPWELHHLTASTGIIRVQEERSNFNVTDPLDRMSMGSTHKGDPRMLTGLLAAYLISIFAMWLLRAEFNWFIVQRYKYLRRRAPQNYSLFVHHIPPNLRSTKALQDWFGVFFKDIVNIHVVKKIPKLDSLCLKRDELRDQLTHEEALLAQRQEGKTSILGTVSASFGKNSVESILVGKISKLKAQLAEADTSITTRYSELQEEWSRHDEAVAAEDPAALQNPPRSILDAAFITFESLQSATCARQLRHHELPFNVLSEEAPVPNHVVWENCGMNHMKKTLQQVLASALTVGICVFWVIPMTFVATFQKVEELKKLGPSGCKEAGNCPIKVASDYVPLLDEILAILAPLALIALSYTLPVILWYVVALEGHIGMNTFHASLFFKLTLFMIVQTFFVSAVAGALFAQLDAFIASPLNTGQEILANSLPAQAVTFMSLIFVKTTYKMMMELLRPRAALYGWLRTFIGPRVTAEERARDYRGLSPLIWILRPFTSPGPLKYHVLFPDLVLMFTVLFVYTVLSPISNVVLLPAFMFINVGYRHQMIYIYDPSNDTGGQLWPQFARYYMVSMLIAQVTILGVLSLNESPVAPLMIPLIICTVLFARYLRQQHPHVAQAMPMFVCHQTDQEHHRVHGNDLSFLDDKYRQKSLIAAEQLARKDPEAGAAEGKASNGHSEPADEGKGVHNGSGRGDTSAPTANSRSMAPSEKVFIDAHSSTDGTRRASNELSAEAGLPRREPSVDAAIGVLAMSDRTAGLEDLQLFDEAEEPLDASLDDPPGSYMAAGSALSLRNKAKPPGERVEYSFA